MQRPVYSCGKASHRLMSGHTIVRARTEHPTNEHQP
jgi:hypothetical protein